MWEFSPLRKEGATQAYTKVPPRSVLATWDCRMGVDLSSFVGTLVVCLITPKNLD